MKTIEISEETKDTLTEIISDIINKVEPITFEELLSYQSQGD